MTAEIKIADLETTKASIDDYLKKLCAKNADEAQKIGVGYEQLWREIGNYFSGGGKRLRPYLTLLIYQAYGGKNPKKVLPAAAAWELLHGCLLIHDDIIDRDDLRHGHPNISGTYKQFYSARDREHLALSTALIAGDLALSSAYQVVAESTLTAAQKQVMFGELSKAVLTVAGGELLDFQAVEQEIQDVDTDIIAQTKTAEYSFCGPMLSGAKLAVASEDELVKIHKLGLNLGIGYQLSDDLLGVFGDQAKTGKPVDSDLREGKRTKLIQETLFRLDEDDELTLTMLFEKEKELTPEDIALLKQLILQSGSVEYIENKIAEYNQKAIAIVNTLDVPAAYKTELINLANKLTQRSQ